MFYGAVLINNDYNPVKFIEKVSLIPVDIIHGNRNPIVAAYH
jgi:hypothetical protein